METKNLITYKKQPDSPESVSHILNKTVRTWFFKRFPSLSLPQLYGVSEVHSRNNILVSAPTGATKTLTAFLAVLNELVDSAQKNILEDKTYAIYISPLKALNNDIHNNLIEPLKEIQEIAKKELGIRIGVRTGDTPQRERAKMLKEPPHILITTPESLAIVCSSPKFKEHLRDVQWCIIDEIHALAEGKRGVHLSLTLERLSHWSSHLCRVGLSATVAPIEEIARYLVGPQRPCKIIDVSFNKDFDFKVLSPVPNLIDVSHGQMHKKLYELIHQLIQEHKTTLIFTNTRAATERVIDHLKNKYPQSYQDNIGAHHGSLSKEHRTTIESRLRAGELKAVACSTSLELGIDIGYIDLVICLTSPKSVARFLQRVGRSGHKLHETVKGRIIVMDRDDLIECSVLVKAAKEKEIDKLHIPRNALDVLAQQIIGITVENAWDENELYETIRKSYCYAKLKRADYNNIIAYLAGEYVDLHERHIYARIWRKEGMIGKRGKMSRVHYMTNVGTIPDESFILAKIGEQAIGKLDEGFVERLKPGDVFVLGGDTYEFRYSRGMVAQVRQTVSRPPTVPHWVSENLPLSFDLAISIGKFRRHILEHFNHGKSKEETLAFINDYLYVDENSARSIYTYFKEQYDYLKRIPNDKSILIEYLDDGYEQKILFHTLFGRRVNDCLSRAIAYIIGKQERKDVEVGVSDNGFYISGSASLRPRKAIEMIRPDKLDLLMNVAIEKSEVYKRRFRHCATRAMMILRNYLGKRKRVGRQQVSSMILMSALRRLDPNFSILKEARREVLEDLMDIANTKKIVRDIREGKIRISEERTNVPSPFAFKLAIMGYMDILKMEDRQEFLRRMHEMIGAKIRHEQDKEQLCDVHQEFTKKAYEKLRPNPKQKRLLDQLSIIPDLSKTQYIELRKLCLGRDNIDTDTLDALRTEREDDIRKEWPASLARLVLQDSFDYDQYWKSEEQREQDEQEELKEQLLVDFHKAARRTDLNPQIRYDVLDLIREDDPHPRDETICWMQDLLKGTIPKIWTDPLVTFLKEQLARYR